MAPLVRLPKGGYTIRWYALSSDGHTVSGVYTFGIRTAAPAVFQAFGSTGPTRTEDVVRWLYFLSLAFVVGGMAFRLIVLPKTMPPAAERRSFIVIGIGAVLVLQVGIAAFLLRAEDALQLPFTKLLYGDLSPIAKGTRFGTAFIAMTLGYAVVAALVFLAWLTDRIRLLWPALTIALVFESGLSLSGHSAVDAGASWLSELADFVHLAAASVWVGGLVMLAAVVWPAAKGLRRDAFLRFSRIATVCIAVILVAGVYLSVLRLPRRQRPLDAELRAGAARQDLTRARRAALGCGSPLRGTSRARARRGRHAPEAAPEPHRREPRRDLDPAARRRARELEAAAAAREDARAGGAGSALIAAEVPSQTPTRPRGSDCSGGWRACLWRLCADSSRG